jgi:uncharacterized protein YbcC (UPF0753/DUF2309 family)
VISEGSFTPQDRLQHWLEHLEHVLPAQAPIRDFVHHNTLHGFQHLPFPEALAAAHRLTGAMPYLPEQQFREFFRQGRITGEDLAAALEEAGIGGLEDTVAAGFRRRQVLLSSLLESAEPPAPARLAWEIRENGREDEKLWAACLARCVPGAAEAAPDEWAWETEARALWPELAGRLGHDWTWRSLLEHLTGEDVLEAVRTVLLRHLAAHLDLGVAAWRNPGREAGFYAAWRASAGLDFAWDLGELPLARDEISGLPEDPMEILAQELSRLLPDEKLWFGYVERLCLELPGWSGMFLWRDRHPKRGDGTPVAMADYLAVRVLLERLLTEDLVRRLAGVGLDLDELGAYFAARPAELYVRHGVRRLSLPDELLHRAETLMRIGGDNGKPREEEWIDLARAMAGDGQAARARREGEAWILYRRALRLGMSAEGLAAMAGEELAALARCAGELDRWSRSQVWLLAYEGHYREEIFAALAANHGRCPAGYPPSAQVVFCMDDREEGTRRHLEEIVPAVETFGAAGFFGVPMYWQGLDDEAPAALCPVVVRPAHAVQEVPEDAALAEAHARRRSWRLAWRERFIQGSRRDPLAGPLLTALAGPAALLSLAGATLAPGWFGRMTGRWRERFEGRVPTRAAVTAFDTSEATPERPRDGFTDAEQAVRVGAFLRSIGLTGGFAPLVALLGHGSMSRNNPHLSAYDCGACSGRHGGPNARVFAAMANRPEVRVRLAEAGIPIPDGTWFLAGEHNTCDDGIEWYDTDRVPASLQSAFDRLVGQLNEAARAHAAERCRRFASAPAAPTPGQGWRHVAGRRHDISEARPELGHATNAAAFIGRRSMSRGLFLDRRVFLISYDPSRDPDGAVVEGILLAAGPVGAGISLEYYFSTVDNERLGCSSKVTHNLVGLFGVMEGADSDLRTGLPRQMIEIHEAMRLLVVVEQTPEVLSAIVARQPALQELIGNGWIVVASQDPDSGALHRFCPRRGWLRWTGRAELPRVARSADWYAGKREALPPALIGEAA